MKRMKSALVIATAVCVSMGSMAMAEGLQDFNDYPEGNGSYAYFFDQGLKLSMSEEWYQNTILIADTGFAKFCHKDSYEKYLEDGIDGGGVLLTIGCSVNADFKDIPGAVFLGFDEELAMNYYAYKPSDYQAYGGDQKIREEYDLLLSEADDVMESAEIYGAVSSVTIEKEKKASSELYDVVENDLFSFECSKNWNISVGDYFVKTYLEDEDTPPGFLVAKLAIKGTAEEELENWKTLMIEKFQNRLCGEPEYVSYTVPDEERTMFGWRVKVSSEDGMDTVTRITLLEELDGEYFEYACAYVSQTYEEGGHEDETTYFEFIHAIDTMEVK